MWYNVVRTYAKTDFVFNVDNYHLSSDNLDDYILQIKAIETKRLGKTWGRSYIEIPIDILLKFGILTNAPFVCYVNYVDNQLKVYGYPGEIFNGDAAWFEEYRILESEKILINESYKRIKEALENTSQKKSFQDFFDTAKDKWKIVPITNHDLAVIANQLNNHIK